ncbi:MAG: MFS transporter, partial [Microbacteriaceae bacterium]|nr:MFS transporter [Microbacteriaceae bacterium]
MTSRTIARDEVALAMRASSPLSARRQRAVTAVLAFASICGSFMQTLVLPVQAALPELLHTGREETAWVITATSLTGAVVTPIAGRIGDMFGKLRVVIGLLGFMVLGSVIAAFSTEIVGLVIGRSLQGFVLGIVPVAMSILRDTLPAERISGGVALVSASVGIGAALGLPLSATIMTVADWHLIFWLSVGLGGLSLLLVLLVVPPSTGTVRGRFDVPGAVGLAVGLSGVLLAISWLHVWGWTSPLTLAFGGGGLLVLVLWGWYETRVASPIADLRLMVRPRVLLANLCSMTTGFAFFSCIVTVPQILELPVGLGSGLGLDVLASAVIVM